MVARTLLALALLLAACAPGPARDMGRVAPWLRADRQRCLLPRDLRENMEAMARRCAEAFVRDNGYTELPADDSTRWVREFEDGEWARVLAARAGTLDAHASTIPAACASASFCSASAVPCCSVPFAP